MPDSQRILLLREYTLYIFQQLGMALENYQNETSGANNNFQKALSVMRERERQLQDAELSLAVTAPMKAGKSTILNAIIGDSILPSRALAMTVLPTRVQLCQDQEDPKLHFSQAFYEAIKEFLDADEFHELNWGNNCVVTGAEQIRQTLTILNDKVRASLQQDKKLRMPLDGKDIPVVYVSFPAYLQRSEGANGSMPKGSLVLIDTPGPNEANIGEALQVIVRNILQEVSMVAVVLDYTQLTSEAAELTKNEVKTIASIIGNDNILYLVNKVDQRRPGDLTTSGVEDFISESYEDNAESGHNMFEISASKGYAAGGFIHAVAGRSFQDEDMRKLPCAISLAQELYELWEEELEDATVDLFNKKANRLWSNSGIEQFLAVCIEELTSRAYEKTVYTSIDYLSNQLQQLEDQLNLQISASNSSAVRIGREIEFLASDISQVENARNQSRLIQETRKNVQDKIYKSIAEAKHSAQLTIKDFFKEDRGRKGIASRMSESTEAKESTKSGGVSLPGPFELLPDLRHPLEIIKGLKQILDDQLSTLSDALTGKGKRDGSLLEFTRRSDADAAMKQIKITLDKRVDAYVRAAKIQVEDEVSRAQMGIKNFTQQTTQKVLRNAQMRLNEAFNAELSLPPPTLNFSYDLEGVSVEPGEAKRVTAGKVVSVTQDDDRWYTLWGAFGLFKRTVQVKLPDEEADVYVIDMQEVVSDVNSSIAKGFESMRQVVEQYIIEDLQQSVGAYYIDVNTFLARYQNILQVTQEQASKSAEEQAMLLDSSRTLRTRIQDNKNQLELVKSGQDLDLAGPKVIATSAGSAEECCQPDSPSDQNYDLIPLLNDRGDVQAGAFLYDSEQSIKILEMIRSESVVGSRDCGGQMVNKLIGDSAAGLAPAFATAMQAGQVMRIVGPPSVVEGLANGSMVLMQSGSHSLGTLVSSGSSKIVGQALFSSAAGIVAPLLVYQAVHAIVGTQQLNQINRRLAGIERTLSQIVERQNARDIGEIFAACTTLNDILSEHACTGHFSPQMQDRLSHCERDLRAHYERLKILKGTFQEKIDNAKQSVRGRDTTLELAILVKEQGEQFGQDVRLLFALSTAVIHIEHGLLLIALEHNPNSLSYRHGQLNERMETLHDALSEMVNLSEIRCEIQECLQDMNWWQRTVFARSKAEQLKEALEVPIVDHDPSSNSNPVVLTGEGVLVWHDPEQGMQARAITGGTADPDSR